MPGQWLPALEVAWPGLKLLPWPHCSLVVWGKLEYNVIKLVCWSCQRWVCFASLFAAPWQGQVEASGNEWLAQGCLVSQQSRLAGLRNADSWVSCFPCGCPSKALMGECRMEISPIMRISHCNSWQSWIAADLRASIQIFSNSSFETPLPPFVLPFASISHFYLMGCFCVCFISCKLW